MANICDTPFWDTNLTWRTSDPDFTQCFQKSILALLPCFFLWLWTPIRFFQLLSKNSVVVPWSTLTTLKLVVVCILFVFATYEVSIASLRVIEGKDEPLMQIVSPLAVALTMALVAFMINLERRCGVRTSGYLTSFWILYLFFGIIRLRSYIKRSFNTGYFSPAIAVHFPCLLFATILSTYSDGKPVKEYYSKVEKICPEKNSSILSRITYWWFTRLLVLGYKRPLTQADLWSLNKENTTEYVSEQFYKNFHVRKPVQSSIVGSRDEREIGFISNKGSAGLASFRVGSGDTTSAQRTIFWTLYHTYFWFFLKAATFKLGQDILVFFSPQLLRLIIEFIMSDQPAWHGHFYASLLLIIGVLQAVLSQLYFHCTILLGMRLRSTVINIIYRKTMRLSNSAKKLSTVGEIVNLMSVDSQMIMEMTTYLHMLWSGPLQIVVAMYFLWQTLGPATLAGIAVMILLIPINGAIALKIKSMQTEQMGLKDSRIKLMNEILSGIKVLKLYAWEDSFQNKVLEVRNKELKVLMRAAYLNSVTTFFWSCAPVLVSLTTFGVFVLSSPNNVLNAEKAFVSLAFFNILRFPLSMIPNVITTLIQTNVSLKRIQKFVENQELDPNCVERPAFSKFAINIKDGTFVWERITDILKWHPVFKLSRINLEVDEGSLVAVVGMVGSGKSSLLSAMLGEMENISGSVTVKGSVSYVAQQAWIQNLTVKKNILFGKAFDKYWYKKVVKACALKPDLAIMPAGDKTEIGEKGINLSGGQKQRVALARAVYQDTDVYILDDPLSAVDSQVGKYLFDYVIGPKGLLKTRTRILVTNGVGFLPQVDKIIVLANGKISETGTFSELLLRKGDFSDFLNTYLTVEEKGQEFEEPAGHKKKKKKKKKKRILEELQSLAKTQSIDVAEILTGLKDAQRKSNIDELSSDSGTDLDNDEAESTVPDAAIDHNESAALPLLDRRGTKVDSLNPKVKQPPVLKNNNNVIQEEAIQTGRVKLTVYRSYIRSMGILLNVWIIIFLLLAVTSGLSSNIWLSYWSDDGNDPDLKNNVDQRNYRLGVYGLLGFMQGALVMVSSFLMALGGVNASRKIFAAFFTNLLRNPMSFFEQNPMGVIMNRCSDDIAQVDYAVHFALRSFLTVILSAVVSALVIAITTPWVLVILPLVVPCYFFVQKFYVATSRQLKRLESVSRSPVYSHFGETIAGAVTIRAFGAEGRFIQESQEKVDLNQTCYYPGVVSNRWLAFRLEAVGSLIVFFAAMSVVLARDDITPGAVGLSLSYAMNLTQTLNWMVRMTCDLENNIVSVERIREYSKTPTESQLKTSSYLIPGWPTKGVIQFIDYKVRYREDLGLVLQGIKCTILQGEKIGIVGRTGAGKSSMTLALFRLIEPAGGSIIIDGIDITTIGLFDLRSRITIIPQEPVIFSGTLRMNLDPFEKYTDDEIWLALELSNMKSFVNQNPHGLLYDCNEGGANFSLGQCQLVCLARALLRKTQILVLDEATAAVDLETDDLIQKTIRTAFADCTVLTIAHRLNTIIDYSRILVLENGMISEFDTPENLLKDYGSVFYSMALDAGLV